MSCIPAGRRAVLAGAVLAAASSALGAQHRVVVPMRAFRSPVALDTIVRTYVLGAPARTVWFASLDAFRELGLPVNTADSTRGVVAATRFARRGTLAGAQMARFFECGTGMTGPHANEWRLEIAIAALVYPASDTTTRLGLASVASGQDVETSSRPVACTPTGSLEGLLLETVRRKLLGGV